MNLHIVVLLYSHLINKTKEEISKMKNLNKDEVIIGEVTEITSTVEVSTVLTHPWIDCARLPKRYNSDGSLAFVWVLVCMYDSASNSKKAMVAKYENSKGWVDDSNENIETDTLKVTHWTPLTPPPMIDNNNSYWSI